MAFSSQIFADFPCLRPYQSKTKRQPGEELPPDLKGVVSKKEDVNYRLTEETENCIEDSLNDSLCVNGSTCDFKDLLDHLKNSRKHFSVLPSSLLKTYQFPHIDYINTHGHCQKLTAKRNGKFMLFADNINKR